VEVNSTYSEIQYLVKVWGKVQVLTILPSGKRLVGTGSRSLGSKGKSISFASNRTTISRWSSSSLTLYDWNIPAPNL
jgi:hypothetical protein